MSKVLLSTIADINIGGTPSRQIDSFWAKEDGYSWVSIADLTSSGKYIINTKEKITIAGINNSNVKLVPKGCFIMSFKLTIGKCALAGTNLYTNEAIASFMPKYKDAFIPEYLYYALPNVDFHKYTDSAIKGITLNKQKLSNIEINVPDLPTQKRIAKILSTLDGQIEKTEAIIAKYQAIKQGMLHDLFTRGIDLSTGKLRPTPDKSPELYKSSPLGLIPKDWEFINFGNKIVSNKYGPRFNANDYSNSGNVKTIRGTDISKDGEILYSQAPKAKLSNLMINANKLIKNDVLIVTTADCGLTTIFNPQIQHENYIPSAYTVRCRFNNDVDVLFIKYYMNTNNAIKQVNSYVRQGTLGNLPSSDILKISLGIPLINEQMKISSEMRAIDSLIKKENLTLNQLRDLKQGLMIRLLK